MQDRAHLLTERRLPESMSLDAMPIEQAVELMSRQDAVAVEAVARERAAIARGVTLITGCLRGGGRLFYVGAGSSGRLGVLDASECPPTFRTDPQTIQGIIAGGEAAMFRAIEGAEDNADLGSTEMIERKIGPGDAVCGIAAGGTTPFVHGALRQAKKLGAATLFISCAQPTPGETEVDVVIRPLVGPEVLTGSTRLKAGTATKLVLNMLTTLTMVQLGKVYENLTGRSPRDQSKALGSRRSHRCKLDRIAARCFARAAPPGGRACEDGRRHARPAGRRRTCSTAPR